MAKQIQFTYDNAAYTLEFNRNSVKMMETAGFDIDQIKSRANTMIPMLWQGAFRMHHKFVKPEVLERIYKVMPRKDELLQQLIEMYSEPMETLFEEPDEGNAVSWTASR